MTCDSFPAKLKLLVPILLLVALVAGVPKAADKANLLPAEGQGDTKSFPRRTWDAEHDFPPHVSTDPTVKFDYPIVYVRSAASLSQGVSAPQPPQPGRAAPDQCARRGAAAAAPGWAGRIAGRGGAAGVHHRPGGFVRRPVGLLRQVPRDGHQGRGPHDPDPQPPGIGHLQGPRAHAQGGPADAPGTHAEHRGRARGDANRIRAASTTWRRAPWPAARSSSSAIATAIAASASRPRPPCSCSSWTTTAATSS